MADVGTIFLAEAMLWLMYAVGLAALVVTAVSVVRPLWVPPRKPSGRGWAVAAFTLLLLAVAWLLASDEPMVVNGTVYSDRLWLKTADTLIAAAAVLVVVAAGFVAYGVSGLNRKWSRLRKK